MSNPLDTPGNLWRVGREHLIEALSSENTPREQVEAAQCANLLFAASSAKSLAIIAEQLAALNVSAAALVTRDQGGNPLENALHVARRRLNGENE